MDIGRDNGLPVDRSYADRSPYAFTGKTERVVDERLQLIRARAGRRSGAGLIWLRIACPARGIDSQREL